MRIGEGSRWGVNLGRTVCPRCGADLDALRIPRTWRQVLWGGWTCPQCAAQLDKWGRLRT